MIPRPQGLYGNLVLYLSQTNTPTTKEKHCPLQTARHVPLPMAQARVAPQLQGHDKLQWAARSVPTQVSQAQQKWIRKTRRSAKKN